LVGFGYDKLTATPQAVKGFVFLYCLANFFQNFGPNSTTFVIPGESFPTRYRSTAHGISAASGKLGAVVAQVGFSRLVNIGGTNKFVKHLYVLFPLPLMNNTLNSLLNSLEIFAFFMLTGIFSTLLLNETKGRTLEELSNEDQEGFVEGVAGRPEVDTAVAPRRT
jgi:MFS transporter, PHS family, inorganic phosphate transporter